VRIRLNAVWFEPGGTKVIRMLNAHRETSSVRVPPAHESDAHDTLHDDHPQMGTWAKDHILIGGVPHQSAENMLGVIHVRNDEYVVRQDDHPEMGNSYGDSNQGFKRVQMVKHQCAEVNSRDETPTHISDAGVSDRKDKAQLVASLNHHTLVDGVHHVDTGFMLDVIEPRSDEYVAQFSNDRPFIDESYDDPNRGSNKRVQMLKHQKDRKLRVTTRQRDHHDEPCSKSRKSEPRVPSDRHHSGGGRITRGRGQNANGVIFEQAQSSWCCASCSSETYVGSH
jgi:hypothetical protein